MSRATILTVDDDPDVSVVISCDRIIEERHHGTIGFESAPGRTVARVRLLLRAAAGQ